MRHLLESRLDASVMLGDLPLQARLQRQHCAPERQETQGLGQLKCFLVVYHLQQVVLLTAYWSQKAVQSARLLP